VAREKDEMIDERFSLENLPPGMHKTSQSLLEEIIKKIKQNIPDYNCRTR
jgi:hypothetical protein